MKLRQGEWLGKFIAIRDPDLMTVVAVVPSSWFHNRAIPFVFERVDFEPVGTLGAVHACICDQKGLEL